MISWYSGQFGLKKMVWIKAETAQMYIQEGFLWHKGTSKFKVRMRCLLSVVWWKMGMTTGFVEVHSLSRCLVYYSSILLTIFK